MGSNSERVATEKQVDLFMSPLGQILAGIFMKDLSGDVLKGKKLDRIRRNNYANLSGDVVHVGTGHGTNEFHNFPSSGINHLLGIDILSRPKYLKNAETHGGIGDTQFVVGDARDSRVFERLGQPADHVVVSFLLCLFNEYEQEQILHNCKKVLKPGGTLHLIEHGKSKANADLQEKVQAVWAEKAHGCHLSYDWNDVVAKAGYVPIDSQKIVDVDGVALFQKPVYSIQAMSVRR